MTFTVTGGPRRRARDLEVTVSADEEMGSGDDRTGGGHFGTGDGPGGPDDGDVDADDDIGPGRPGPTAR